MKKDGLIYSCIKIDGNIKFEIKENEFKLKEKFLMEHILNFKVEKSVKILKVLNEYQIFGLNDADENISFFCISTISFPIRISNDYLLEMKNKMNSIYSIFKENKKRMKELNKLLHEQFKLFNNVNNDIFIECKDLIEIRKEETQKNIDAALERGDSIDRIVEKVDKIETVGFSMKGKSKKLKSSLNCQNLILYFLIFFISIVIVISIIFILILKYVILKDT
eukprot:gene4209-7546_t